MECAQDWLNEMPVSLYPVAEIMSARRSREEVNTGACAIRQILPRLTARFRRISALQHKLPFPSLLRQDFIVIGSQKLSMEALAEVEFWDCDLKRMIVMKMLTMPKKVSDLNGSVYKTGFGMPLSMSDVCFTWKRIEDQKVV